MLTLWNLALFLQNWSQSTAFVELYKQTTKTCVFHWEIMFYSRRNVDFRAYGQPYTISCDNSLKTRVILSKLVLIDSIRWTLLAERKNMRASVRNNDELSKKHRFSCISPTEHDILCMIVDNSLKTLVIPTKLVSIDSTRWTLQAECENMSVSIRNYDLYSKKRRISCISTTEHDILSMIEVTLWKQVLFLQN